MRRLGLTLVVALLAVPATAAPAPDVVAGVASYVAGRVRADGAYDGAPTSQAVQALAAAGVDPRTARRDPSSPSFVDWLAANPPAVDANAYAWEQAILGIAAAGEDPSDFGGVNHTARLRAHYVGGQMGSPAYVNDDVWGILALRAAGAPPRDPAIAGMRDTILASQALDGSWSHVMFQSGDVDVTGAAVTALVEAGLAPDHEAVGRGLSFLESRRDLTHGGWPARAGLPVNVQSTAWALNAYRAAGVAPPAGALEFIERARCSDGGLAAAPPATSCDRANPWATVEGLVALAGARVPVRRHLAVEAVAIPPAARAHEPVVFEARFLAAPSEVARIDWRFGDDAVGSGARVEHAYSKRGNYRATVEVETIDGRAGSATVEVSVDPAPPVAVVTATPATAHRGVPVALSAHGSGDPDGRIASYTFDFGDGRATPPGPEPVALHAWSLPGVYTVKVTVVDDDGLSASAATEVTVENRAPTLAVAGPYSADRLTPIRLAVAADDADGDALAWNWTFPDGTTSREAEPEALFSTLGSHAVEARACDAFGGCGVATFEVGVVNLPPRLAVPTGFDAVAGEPFVLEARASDPEGRPLEVTWRVANETAPGPVARFTLDREGEHAAVARARDADGGTIEAAVVVRVAPAGAVLERREPAPFVEVAPRTPATLVLEAPVVEGRLVRFLARIEPDDGAARTYRFEFGDGAATGWLDAAAATHRYTKPGLAVATVAAREADGTLLGEARVVVRLANRAPALRLDEHAFAGDVLVARGAATDPDGDAVRVVARVAGREVEAGGALWSASFAGLPAGPGTLTVIGFDGEGLASEPLFLPFEAPPTRPARDVAPVDDIGVSTSLGAATQPAATPGAALIVFVGALGAAARFFKRRG